MTVAEAFEKFKSNLELAPTYQSIVSARHKAVKSALENALPTAEAKVIGSIQRKTRIQPPQGLQDFDIDILVILDNFTRFLPVGSQGVITPSGALEKLDNAVSSIKRYEAKDPEVDAPTVTLTFEDSSRVELVPAFRDMTGTLQPSGRAYWVPKDDRWTIADYDYDADYISAVNQQHGGQLVPLIKMLKAWKRTRVREMKSFHLEVLATLTMPMITARQNASGRRLGWAELLQEFFLCGKSVIARTAVLPGSLSEPADSYLAADAKGKLENIFNEAFGDMGYIASLSDTQAIPKYCILFGDAFPSV